MLKTVSSVVAALACVAPAAPSHAQSFSPSSGTASGTGMVTLKQSVTITCALSTPTISLTPTTAAITGQSISPGSFLCGAFGTTFGAWSLAVVPGSTTLVDVTFGFSAGSTCYGTTTAQWSNVTRRITFTNAVLPGPPSCTVSGYIDVPLLQIL
jgi:hypothetical protein